MRKSLITRGLVFFLGASLALSAQDSRDLARFLAKAKKEGYAADDPKRVHKVADGGDEAGLREGDFVYRDRWYGENPFSGQEVVWHKGKTIWSLNFWGQTLSNAPSEFPHFHKRALRNVGEDLPLRGPACFREGEFIYVNDVKGTLQEFTGVERVYYQNREIYRLVYHGGTIRE